MIEWIDLLIYEMEYNIIIKLIIEWVWYKIYNLIIKKIKLSWEIQMG